MRKYIFALVLTAETGKDEAKAKKLVESLVQKVDGKVKDVTVLGLRDLAYPIVKQEKGWYGFFSIELPENKPKHLKKEAVLNPQILRHLLLVKD